MTRLRKPEQGPGGALGPLSGMRIVSVEQYGAGPYATSLLADLGAEVIKVETPPAGDVARDVPPYAQEGDSLYFESLNRNKKSIFLDTTTEHGRAVVERLVRHADAVFNNLRGDQPAARGLDYASLSPHNPRIVCVHLNGYGREGEHSADPAYDYLMQGYSGWMHLTGEPGSIPQKTGLSLVDFSAGMLAALAIVSGVRGATTSGHGGDYDVPLIDVSLSLLNYLATWHLTMGYVPQRQPDSSHPSQVPSQILPTADGWIVVMCAKEKFFTRLARLIDLGELLADPRFEDFVARLENREALTALLKERMKQRTTKAWIEILRGEVPCAPVNTFEEAFQDPVVLARDMIVETEHPRFGNVRSIRSPIRFDSELRPRRGPRLGEHTDEILQLLSQLEGTPEHPAATGTDGPVWTGGGA